jgi:hypothetical protein
MPSYTHRSTTTPCAETTKGLEPVTVLCKQVLAGSADVRQWCWGSWIRRANRPSESSACGR